MRERLIDLLYDVQDARIDVIADHLLANGVIVLPCDTVWFIVDKNTKYAMAMSRQTDELPLYMLRDLNKYGYYKTKEEAEAKLKEGKG